MAYARRPVTGDDIGFKIIPLAILDDLRNKGARTMRQLAEDNGTSPDTVGLWLRRLELRGFVARVELPKRGPSSGNAPVGFVLAEPWSRSRSGWRK